MSRGLLREKDENKINLKGTCDKHTHRAQVKLGVGNIMRKLMKNYFHIFVSIGGKIIFVRKKYV